VSGSRLSEWFSPEQKYQNFITDLCVSCRPNEGFSLEREKFSPKLKGLAWARIRPIFSVLFVLSLAQARLICLGEKTLSPRRDFLTWAKTTTVECLIFCCCEWLSIFNINAWTGMIIWFNWCFDNMRGINVWIGLWELRLI